MARPPHVVDATDPAQAWATASPEDRASVLEALAPEHFDERQRPLARAAIAVLLRAAPVRPAPPAPPRIMPNRYPGPPRRAVVVGGRRGGESPGDPGDEFPSEAQEIVEGLGRDLLAIDEGVRAGKIDPGLVNDVFRAVHTLKGLAGLFGANRMASLSHELEELLDHLRLGRVELTASVLDLLFRFVALYGRILQAEKEGRDQAIPEVDDLIRDLRRGTGGPREASSVGQYELDPSLLAVLTEYEEHRLRANIQQGRRIYRLRVQLPLETIDQAIDALRASARPHGEIIAYLPTGAGADADAIELDILMAAQLGLKELRAALGGRDLDLEEIARRPVTA